MMTSIFANGNVKNLNATLRDSHVRLIRQKYPSSSPSLKLSCLEVRYPSLEKRLDVYIDGVCCIIDDCFNSVLSNNDKTVIDAIWFAIIETANMAGEGETLIPNITTELPSETVVKLIQKTGKEGDVYAKGNVTIIKDIENSFNTKKIISDNTNTVIDSNDTTQIDRIVTVNNFDSKIFDDVKKYVDADPSDYDKESIYRKIDSIDEELQSDNPSKSKLKGLFDYIKLVSKKLFTKLVSVLHEIIPNADDIETIIGSKGIM